MAGTIGVEEVEHGPFVDLATVGRDLHHNITDHFRAFSRRPRVGDTAWPVFVVAYLHAQQQHVVAGPEVDPMMEGLSLNRDAILRRNAIAISSGGVPLAHDGAVERHLQDESVDNADEQVAVRQMPYALHRSVGLMNAMDVA